MFNETINMLRVSMYYVVFVLAAFAASGASMAEVSPPSWTASPDVYKVATENRQFRVIEATWKPGQRDQWHSHANGGFFYYVTDCSLRLHNPDGNTRDVNFPAGDAGAQPAFDSHWIENVGKQTCKVVLFEPK